MTRSEMCRLGVSLAAAFAAGWLTAWGWIFEHDSRPHGSPFDRHLDDRHTDGTIARRNP